MTGIFGGPGIRKNVKSRMEQIDSAGRIEPTGLSRAVPKPTAPKKKAPKSNSKFSMKNIMDRIRSKEPAPKLAPKPAPKKLPAPVGSAEISDLEARIKARSKKLQQSRRTK